MSSKLLKNLANVDLRKAVTVLKKLGIEDDTEQLVFCCSVLGYFYGKLGRDSSVNDERYNAVLREGIEFAFEELMWLREDEPREPD